MRVAICDKCYFEGKLKLSDYRINFKDAHRHRRLTAHLCEEHLRQFKKEVSDTSSLQAYLVWIGYGFSLKRYVTQVSPSP